MSRYIGISTPTFDLGGNLLFKADITTTELKNMNRRVSRSATLDGGVSIIDSGFAHGDRTFNIVADLTETQCARLEYIVQNYSEVILAVPEGIFSANLKSYQNHHGSVRLEILINEKLAPVVAPVYYCAFDETFHDLAHWYTTTQHGTETATIVVSGLDRECRLDLPDFLDTEIKLLYQYLVPVGDFDIMLDVNDYIPDNSSDGFWLALRIRSSDELYYAEVRAQALSAPPNLYTITTEFRENTVYTTSPLASEYPLEAIRITRVGNEITLTYHNNSWYVGDIRDFGAHSGDLDRVEIIAYDSGTRGGSVDVDNLVFRAGCPVGYPKAWSTTTTSSTMTTTTTVSASTTSSSFSSSSTTTSTSSSSSSTLSSSSSSSSTASTLSTTSSSSTSSCSTISTISTTCSTSTTTTSSTTESTTTTTISSSSSTSSCSSTNSTVSTTSSTSSTASTVSTSSSTLSTVSTTSTLSTLSTTSTTTSSSSTTTTIITTSSSSTSSTLSTLSTFSSSSSTLSTISTLSTTSSSSSTLSTVSTISTTSSSLSSSSTTLTTTTTNSTTTSSTLSTLSTTSTCSTSTTTTTYWCEYNDVFNDLDWWLHSTKGSGTMTLVSGKMRLDIPDSADDNSKVDFQYYLPSGDFDIQIDLSNYTPDDSDDGCTVSFYCTDSALTNYTQIRFRTDNGSPIYRSNITYRINSGTPQTGSIERSSIAPTILRVTRSGNDLTAYVFVIGTGWISLGTVDFGAYASEPDIVKIILGDTNNRGGYVDFDNLTFNSCCPTGYPKAWTTTTTTTTTTCTTTSTAPP